MCASHKAAALLILLFAATADAEQVLFEDNFERRLSDKWQVIGLSKDDYRVRDNGLELRVQPGEVTKDVPRLQCTLPYKPTDSLIASVKVTPLDDFRAEHEHAGVYLLESGGPDFRATKELVGGNLVFAPGNYVFKGKPGNEEGNPKSYEVKYTPATSDAGPLGIIVDRGNAFFQVGPSAERKYLNFFHSAIDIKGDYQGFCLIAAGAPEGASHWVRFVDFRVVKP